MDAKQFAYWLQGFAELSGDAPPTPEQWKSIREHLALVFEKVTPPVGFPNKDDIKPQDWRLPNINEMLRPPPQKAGDVWPWTEPTVRCSTGVALTHDTATRTYC